MRRIPTLFGLVVALLVGCNEADGPAGPDLARISAAAAGSTGLRTPSNASALAASETQVDLSWQDNSQNETGFEVHRSTTGESGTYTLLATTGADAGTYHDQGLASDTQYCYKVRAVRVSASNTTYSAFSNTACTTTPPPPPPPPPPPAPAPASGTHAVPSSSITVAVDWTDNSTNEDGFRIHRSIDGGVVWNLAGTVGANTQWWDGDAQAEQPVCYRVVAFNAGGDAPPSNVACTTPPAAPSNLTVTAVNADTLEFAWNDNSSTEDGYELWWVSSPWLCCVGPACDAGGGTLELLVAALPANSTTYRMAGSTSDGCPSSWYYVVARKDGGFSDQSAWVPVP